MYSHRGIGALQMHLLLLLLILDSDSLFTKFYKEMSPKASVTSVT